MLLLPSQVSFFPNTLTLQSSFLPDYLQIVSRKFLLFHGRRGRGYACKHEPVGARGDGGSCGAVAPRTVLRAAELSSSPVMAELQELLTLPAAAELERDLFSNFFSLQVCDIYMPSLQQHSVQQHHSTSITTACKQSVLHVAPALRHVLPGGVQCLTHACPFVCQCTHAEHSACAVNLYVLGHRLQWHTQSSGV